MKDLETSSKDLESAVLEENLDEEILQIVEFFSKRQEKLTIELRQEIAELKADRDALMKWKADTQLLVKKDHERSQDLQNKNISSCNEKERILQCCVFQERSSVELENIKVTLNKLMQDEGFCKQANSKLEDMVHQKLNKLQSVIHRNAQEVNEKLKVLDDFEQHKKDIENRWIHEREKERALMMDKLETLSRLYLMGLDELRVALLNLKLGFGSKIEELARCLDLTGDLRLSTELYLHGKQKAEVVVSSSRNLLEDGANNNKSGILCAQEQNSLLKPTSFVRIVNDVTHTQLAKTPFPKRLKSDMDARDNLNHMSICSCIENCEQKQDEQTTFKSTSPAIAESKVMREIMAEMQNLLEKARELLAQILSAKKQSAELAKEMLAEFDDWKKGSTEFNQLLSKTNSIKVGCRVLSKKPLISCQETTKPPTVGSTAAEIGCCQTQENKFLTVLAVPTIGSCLEQPISQLLDLRNKTSHFLGRAAAELAALEGPKQRLIGFMGASNEQAHAKIHDAILGCVNILPGECALEIKDFLEDWEQLLHYDTEKVKCIEQGLKEVKERVSSLICLGNTFLQEIEHHLRCFEQEVIDRPARKVEAMEIRNDCDCATMVAVKQQQSDLRKDVDFFKDKVNILASMLGELRNQSKATGQGEEQVFESSQMMHELDKKIMKLDSLQLNVSSHIKEMQFQMKEFETIAVDWGIRYDTATRVLNELDSRLRLVEGLIWHKADNTGPEFLKKKQLLCLHIHEAVNGRMDTEPERSACSSNSEAAKIEDASKQPENRMVNLESRIEHVASAAYANLRILDAKVQQISIGIQTALESAAMAEKKCNALGAELVKVFRNLARSTKDKSLNANRASDGRHSRCAVRRSNIDMGLKERSCPFAVAQHSKRTCLKSCLGSHSKEGRILRMNRTCETFHWC